MNARITDLLNGSSPPKANTGNSPGPANADTAALQDLPPMPAQQREEALSRGMLIASMVTVLLLLAILGGLAVYITQRHKAAPEMKDL